MLCLPGPTLVHLSPDPAPTYQHSFLSTGYRLPASLSQYRTSPTCVAILVPSRSISVPDTA
eukprot:2069423-Rhodomonas_salina.3